MRTISDKPKTCKTCRQKFVPTRPLQVACSISCALELARVAQVKKQAQEATNERAEHAKRKEATKTKGQWAKEAQAAVNAYVRLRDAGLGCVSCAKPANWQGQWHASHFRSRGAAPHLRFNLWNIHKSCSVCNNHLSGNILGYKPELLRRIGADRVQWIESANWVARHDIDYLKRIKSLFAKKRKRLEARRNAMQC